MGPLKPPLPGESAGAYHRRITAAEGAPIDPVVVYQEHHFWVFLGAIIKRWQMLIGLFGIVSVVVVLTLKIGKLVEAVDEAAVKLARVDKMVTTTELDAAIAKITNDVTARVVDNVHEKVVERITNRKDIVVSCPWTTVRGASNKPCQIERLKTRE